MKHRKIIYLILAVIVGLIPFFFKQNIEFVKSFGYLGIFIINLVDSVTLFFPTPALVAVVMAGIFLNPFLVAIASAFGASIGELTGYMVGVGGEELVEKNKWFLKIKGWMDKKGALTLFILALIPNPFFDIAGITAGATGMSIKKYLSIVFFGKLIKFFIFAYLGSNLYRLP